MKKFVAECLGTLILVLFGCGVAVWTRVDTVSTALAFGLTIVTLAYSIGPISGCHVNPAVSLGVWMTGGMKTKDLWRYLVAQFLGGILGAFFLGMFLGRDFTMLGSNGLDGVNGNIWLGGTVEIILTFVFVFSVLGVTSKKEYNSIAGLVIGLSLVLVHLLGLGFTGTSVNPARSFGPALLEGAESLKIVWIFIIAPFIGAVLAGCFYNFFGEGKKTKIFSF